MFFNIGPNKKEDFPNHVLYNNTYIGLDPGWSVIEKEKEIYIFKGLTDNGILSNIENIVNESGSVCFIQCQNNQIKIFSGDRRTFPIFYNESEISNLYRYENCYCENENLITNNVQVVKNTQDVKYENLNLNDEELFECLYNYLDQKISKFDKNIKIRVWPTGGVDTMMIISFIIKHNIPYEIVDAEYKAQDYFVCYNRGRLKNFWAYNNIIYSKDFNVLMTGGNGDEMMLRNPQDAFLVAKANGDDIIDILKNSTTQTYHSEYFLKEKNIKLYKEVENINLDVLNIKNHIIRRNYFDYQFWHIGNTFTWAPLNDLKICNIMLNFSYKTLLTQLTDARITKKIIEKNDSTLLKYVSPLKNNNGYKLLYKIFEGTESFS
jgi:hypothetical protein